MTRRLLISAIVVVLVAALSAFWYLSPVWPSRYKLAIGILSGPTVFLSAANPINVHPNRGAITVYVVALLICALPLVVTLKAKARGIRLVAVAFACLLWLHFGLLAMSYPG